MLFSLASTNCCGCVSLHRHLRTAAKVVHQLLRQCGWLCQTTITPLHGWSSPTTFVRYVYICQIGILAHTFPTSRWYYCGETGCLFFLFLLLSGALCGRCRCHNGSAKRVFAWSSGISERWPLCMAGLQIVVDVQGDADASSELVQPSVL